MAEATEIKAEVSGIKTSVLRNVLNSKDASSSIIKGGADKIGEQVYREIEAKKAAMRKAKQAQILAAEETKNG